MALIEIGTTQRFEIPHEPGEWVDLRPLPWARFTEITSKPGVEKAIVLVRESIAAWSYDAEVTAENIDRIDVQTAKFIAEAVLRVNGVEGKGGAASSSASIEATGAIPAS